MGSLSNFFWCSSSLKLINVFLLLKDLLLLNTDGVSIDNFNPDSANNLRWKAKTRRPDKKKRKRTRNQLHASVLLHNFVGERGLESPELIPEFMAYKMTIRQVSQNFTRLE